MITETPKKKTYSPVRSPYKPSIPVPQLDFSPTRDDSMTEAETISCIPTLPISGIVPRITGKTLADMLNGFYDEFFESLFIVDCRYAYEYDGGHIQGAVNINKPEDLSDAFFEEIYPNATIVFHCEFSHNRGPEMARIFRSFDRELNKDRYPELFYPNIYILNGGYKKFYAEHSELCDGGYVLMLDEEHKENGNLVKSTSEYRKSIENLNKENSKALVDMKNYSAVCFTSPASGPLNESPSAMASKMLNFLSSPVCLK
jgi:rhodanese-related sulfurtransferase